MKIDSYGLVSLSHEEIFNLFYEKGIENPGHIYTESSTAERFNASKNLNKDAFEDLKIYKEPLVDIKVFDANNQNNWFMPEEYKNLKIDLWLLDQCKNNEEVDRVNEELVLFRQYNMINVLKFLKYLVDTMRSNNIVWGVGRGSSVASFCLFLIGVHRINSLKYKLDISEFLK